MELYLQSLKWEKIFSSLLRESSEVLEKEKPACKGICSASMRFYMIISNLIQAFKGIFSKD